MISYGRQHIDQNDINSVTRTLKSRLITQGPLVSKFEKELCKETGYKYASAVSNGTAALHLIGLALGWKNGDIILTTPISFLATSNSIIYCGARPEFVDIEKDFYTIDVEKLERKIKFLKKKKKKVKAIVCTDFAGHPCNWPALKKLSKRFKIKLVNDNCHSLGAQINKNKLYSSKFSDFSSFSFHPVKSITTGEGGAVLTNDKKLDRKIKLLRSHGMVKENKFEIWKYEMRELGYNYRISDIQCALGVSQLKKLKKFIKKRKSIALNYDRAFKNIKNISIPKIKKNYSHAYHLYPLKINFQKFGISKKIFFKKMKQNNILLQVHYIPIHLQPYYKKKFNTKSGSFLVSENFYNQEVSLPIFYDLKKIQQEKVIKNIKKLLKI